MDNGQQSKLSINLQPHQEELIQLSELAGIRANPRVHNIIIELLNMQAEPQAIFNVLKAISKPRHSKSHSRKSV